ncbi:MAG: histone deacetylase [Planctomyces sp.]|jgi:acetoin utilization deacetylase AcuC-like enzyme
MTLFYSDPGFQRHQTGDHPECPIRVAVLEQHLQRTGLLQRVSRCPAVAAADADLLLVHTQDHLQELRRFAAAGGGRIEADTVLSPESADVAWQAAGTAIDAVRRVLAGEDRTAFCAIRPPGHHALPSSPMGFCLLGNAAAAAAAAIHRWGLARVLVVDWDVHHGNGTQDTFYEDGRVGFLSSHRFPFYPGTGRRDEIGTGDGLGTTFNLPVAFGTPRSQFLRDFQAILDTAVDRIRPELIILSAGFDAHAEDPVGSLGLETEDFETLTRAVLDAAAVHSGGRVVSLLEGGYNPARLAESAGLHLQTLLEAAPATTA